MLRHVWKNLWDDFERRARRLDRFDSDQTNYKDPIDRVISWQLRSDQESMRFVDCKLPLRKLHLPELYSGAPWRSTGVGAGNWIAWMTINPSHDAQERFPTIELRKELGDDERLIEFFDTRFDFPWRTEGPLPRGRNNEQHPRCFRTHGGKSLDRGNQTWSRIDKVTHDAIQRTWPAKLGLGDAAAIIDVCPHKFKNWREIRRELDACSVEELVRNGWCTAKKVLAAHHPRVAIFAGKTVWSAIEPLLKVSGQPCARCCRVYWVGRLITNRSWAGPHVLRAWHVTRLRKCCRNALVTEIERCLSARE